MITLLNLLESLDLVSQNFDFPFLIFRNLLQSLIFINLILFLLFICSFFVFRSHHILNALLDLLLNLFLKFSFLLGQVFNLQFLFVQRFISLCFNFMQVLLVIFLAECNLFILKFKLLLVLFFDFLFLSRGVSLHAHFLSHPFLHLVVDGLLHFDVFLFIELLELIFGFDFKLVDSLSFLKNQHFIQVYVFCF